MASIRFLGAARTVTGSKYLLDTGASKVLIDAGLFQGLKELRERNWQPFPIPAAEIDAIVLTHAHLDSLRLSAPVVSQGLPRTRVLQAGTLDLCRIRPAEAGRNSGRRTRADEPTVHGYSSIAPAAAALYRGRRFVRLAAAPIGYDRPDAVTTDVEVEFVKRRPPPRVAPTRAIRTGRADSSLAGDLGRFGRPACRTRRPSPKRTTCSSSRRMGNGFTNRTTMAPSWRM